MERNNEKGNTEALSLNMALISDAESSSYSRDESEWKIASKKNNKGSNASRRSIPNESNFQQNRNRRYTRNTSKSFKGRWNLLCENIEVCGTSEADVVWKALNELHEEIPTLFHQKPSKESYGNITKIMCYTPDYRDVENIQKVAKAMYKRIHYPYTMNYLGQSERQLLFLYTPENEFYSMEKGLKFLQKQN